MSGYAPIDVAHNADILGDTTYTVSLNFRWRRLVAELLLPLCIPSAWDGDESEQYASADFANDLVRDLYDNEGATTVSTQPSFQVSRLATFNIVVSGAWQPIPWDIPDTVYGDYDPDGWLQAGTLYCPTGKAGWYLMLFQAYCVNSQHVGAFDTTSGGRQGSQWYQAAAGGSTPIHHYSIVYIADGDTLNYVVQNQGATLRQFVSINNTYKACSLRAVRLQRDAPD